MEKLIEIISKKRNLIIELTGVYIFTLILHLVYILVYDNNGEFIIGFESNYNFFKCVLSFIIIGILFSINQSIEEDFIRFFNKIFIYLMLIPISAIYTIKDYSTIVYLLFVLEFAIIINGTKHYFNIKINFGKIGEKIKEKINISNLIYIIFWIITFIIIGACLYYNGIPGIKALNLKNVYSVREKFYLPNKYINYLYTFEVKFIILFLVMINLHKKRYKEMFVAIFIQLLFFLWKGDKIVLLSCPAVVLTYLFMNKFDYKKYIDKNIIWVIIWGFVISICLYICGWHFPLSLFIRRLLLVPANLKFVYIDFFSKNTKIGSIGTILHFFFKTPNPYGDTSYQHLISDIYFNKPKMYSNTGFLSEGFARWGYIGFIIIPIIYCIILKILNKGSKNTSFAFFVSISLIPLINLNDGYFITSLTFGAIGLLVFVSLFFNIDDFEPDKLLKKIKKKEE